MKNLLIVIPEKHSNLSSIILTFEVFTVANEYFVSTGAKPVFKIQLVGSSTNTMLHGGLFSIHPDVDLNDNPMAHLIMIPALDEHINQSLKDNTKLIEWVTRQYKQGAEVASLCTGAFLLAAAGILEGKQCSTHWQAAGVFKQLFPGLDLKTEKIVTDQQGVYTTGGALSSMNLILHLVEKYYNRETAIYCAKIFEIDLDRNSQSPFTIFSGQKNHEDKEIKKAQLYMEKNLGEKINMETLAAMFSIDRRNFDRRFKKATSNTPAEYLQRIKIEAAKKSFETTRKNVMEVMYDIGYNDIKAFRVVFKKITGLSPIEYRNRYNKEVAVFA
jgi:transcriptional regulator GlxA family with amidase domain